MAMRLPAIILVAIVASLMACSADRYPTPTPVPTTPPEPTPISTAPPELTRTLTATPPVSTDTSIVAETRVDFQPLFDLLSVPVEFPDWTEESFTLAHSIAVADVIARARLESIDLSTVKDTDWEGNYEAELKYKFKALQYLKGHGDDELTVYLPSGPRIDYGMSWAVPMEKSYARELGTKWKAAIFSELGNRDELVLFLSRFGQDFHFSIVEPNRGALPGAFHLPGWIPHPVQGESWLPQHDEMTYQAKLSNARNGLLSLAVLKDRIEDIQSLMTNHGNCLAQVMNEKSIIRAKGMGTYQPAWDGVGVRPPSDPIPRHETMISVDEQEGTVIFSFIRQVRKESKYFRHSWLDGENMELFVIDTVLDRSNPDKLYFEESLRPVQPLDEGEYRVIYSESHWPSSCGIGHHASGNYAITDSTEWIVKVTATEKDGDRPAMLQFSRR